MLYTDTLIPLLQNRMYDTAGVSWRTEKKLAPSCFLSMWQSPKMYTDCGKHHRDAFVALKSLVCVTLNFAPRIYCTLTFLQLSSQDRAHHLLRQVSVEDICFHPAVLRTATSDHMKQPMISMARQLFLILPVVTSVGNYYRHSRIKVR